MGQGKNTANTVRPRTGRTKTHQPTIKKVYFYPKAVRDMAEGFLKNVFVYPEGFSSMPKETLEMLVITACNVARSAMVVEGDTGIVENTIPGGHGYHEVALFE